jgi:hypothetical protein
MSTDTLSTTHLTSLTSALTKVTLRIASGGPVTTSLHHDEEGNEKRATLCAQTCHPHQWSLRVNVPQRAVPCDGEGEGDTPVATCKAAFRSQGTEEQRRRRGLQRSML